MQAEKEAGTMSKSLSSDGKSLTVPLQPRAALRTASADEGSQQQACLPAPRGGCEQTRAMWAVCLALALLVTATKSPMGYSLGLTNT